MSARSMNRPTWQTDRCPSWCVVEHAEDDLPSDRVHDSLGHLVPATLLRHVDSPPMGVDLLVVMSRRCNTSEDWVFIGEPPRSGQHLSLSRDSTTRLASVLRELLVD